MLRTGEKGKTYGLVKPGLKPSALKPSVFAQDDDDDDNADVNAQLREVSRKKLKQVYSYTTSQTLQTLWHNIPYTTPTHNLYLMHTQANQYSH